MSTIIQKKSLADEVAERLEKEITSSKYKVGDQLPTEPQLMKLYGVGRSSIREAIKILCNRGYLEVQQGVGTFIQAQTSNHQITRQLQRAAIHEVNEVRQILELRIVEKAALNRTEKDIAQIKKHLAERAVTSKKGLLEKCIEADINFHTAIADATHNSILAELYRLVANHLTKGFKHIYNDTSSFAESQVLHEQLTTYIIAQDGKKAYTTSLKIIGQD